MDLIVENDRAIYRCGDEPTHMSGYIDKFKYKLPYPRIFGGVTGRSMTIHEPGTLVTKSVQLLLVNSLRKQTAIQMSTGVGEAKMTIYLCEHMEVRVKEYLGRTNRFIGLE